MGGVLTPGPAVRLLLPYRWANRAIWASGSSGWEMACELEVGGNGPPPLRGVWGSGRSVRGAGKNN